MAAVELKVQNFRGIREGALAGFSRINVLVGKNGGGKSTVLEAIHIALSPFTALPYAVLRRGWFGLASVDALFHRGAREAGVSVVAGGEEMWVRLRRLEALELKALETLKAEGLLRDRYAAIDISAEPPPTQPMHRYHPLLYFDSQGEYRLLVPEVGEPDRGLVGYRLASPESLRRRGEPLALFLDWNAATVHGRPEEAFAFMVRMGGMEAKRAVLDLLREVYGDVEDVVTVPAHGNWVLYVAYRDHAVPYYVVGDGVRYTLVYLMTVLAPRGAVLLMEEPELHSHPRLMRAVARAIVRSAERDNQVFLTTHSLEFVEMLAEEAERRRLGDAVRFYRVSLSDGELHSTVYTLDEVKTLVKEVEVDIR